MNRRRAVILVGNPANPYSRAIRIGRTLVEQGFEVEIAATFEEGAPLVAGGDQYVVGPGVKSPHARNRSATAPSVSASLEE